ncbi:APC family permease [Streptococcus hillyeri]|uniref:APC family permease n=1 Tax=Streptococcus hillyeri TaxID=2282420 RepID=A0A3L9DWP6_9STRE|nr:APC family permease [Streptococcus hillyeri]RLY03602.1 APC family permease [Streptococcus hillyeri]
MKNQDRQVYGLSTAIALIVGVVIGSGIYFKVDDILSYAGGNVGLGMLIIVLGSFSIVFGALSLSELATRNDDEGGIFSYYMTYLHPGLAASLGLFSAYVYLPALNAVVAWVAASFTLGSGSKLEYQILLAAVYLILLALMNLFSRILAGRFQSLSTVLKIIPLLAIALVGLSWGKAVPEIPQGLTPIEPREVGLGWLSGLMPLYFAYDGWTVVASIAPELKNPKKNLAKAFIIGPLVILTLYLVFFYGLSRILGPSFIMTTGNDAVLHATKMIYGETISKLLLVIIIIAVLGVSNGLMLSNMRLPQAFAARGWIKNKQFAKVDRRYQLSISASLSTVAVTLLWLGIHYLATKYHLLPGSDISEVAIVFNNMSFILLYVAVIGLYRKGEITNKLTGLFSPIFAILSIIALFVGSLLTNFVMATSFMLFCLLFCLGSFALYRKNTGQK